MTVRLAYGLSMRSFSKRCFSLVAGFCRGGVLVAVLPMLLSCSTASTSDALVVHRNGDPVDEKHHYVINRGDTLYSIAFRYGYDYRQLAEWNDIKPPYTIYVGQKIRLLEKSPKATSRTTDASIPPAAHNRLNLEEKIAAISNNNRNVLKYIWRWPLKGKVMKQFSQSGNKGIDIAGNDGQSVLAAAEGTVVYSGHGLIGYGNLVIVKHSEMYLSAYGYNKRLLVKEGDYVIGGQAIAEIGQITRKMPLLHFEIRKDGKPVDPMNYLPK